MYESAVAGCELGPRCHLYSVNHCDFGLEQFAQYRVYVFSGLGRGESGGSEFNQSEDIDIGHPVICCLVLCSVYSDL